MVPARDTWSLPGPLKHIKRGDPASGEKGEGRVGRDEMGKVPGTRSHQVS